MKHGKRPTRRQKGIIQSYGLNADEWLVVKDSQEVLQLVHKQTGEVKTYPKE